MTSRTETIENLEEDLSRSREQLRENMSALSEKMTVGQILDDFLFDGRFDWNKVGGKAADASKIVLPGALLGAGIAMLAYQGVNIIPGVNRSKSSSSGDGLDRPTFNPAYNPGYDPTNDFEADRIHSELDDIERVYPRRPTETDVDWHDRVAHRHASVLGYQREEGEEDHGFSARLREGVQKARDAGRSARQRLSKMTSGAMHSGAHMASSAKHAVSSGLHSASYGMKAATKGVTNAGKAQMDRAAELVDTNPMLGVAIGIGIGALIGAAIPVSQGERKAMAKPVNKLMTQAAEVGEKLADKVERATDQVHQAVAGGVDEAKRKATKTEPAGTEASQV